MKGTKDTKYVFPKKEDVEIVVGDEKQDRFYPRMKIMRWDNEVNFSVGVISDHVGSDSKPSDKVEWGDGHGTKARFYEKSPIVKPTIIPDSFRYIDLGAITPEMMERVYEIERHGIEPTIMTYTTDADCFVVHGHQPFTDYIDKKHTINEVRLLNFGKNSPIMFGDPNTAVIDIQFDSSVYSTQMVFDTVSSALCREFGLSGHGRYYNASGEKVATLIQSKNHVVGYIRFQTIDRSKFLQYCNAAVNDAAEKYKVGSVNGDINTFIKSFGFKLVDGVFTDVEINYSKIVGNYDVERNVLEVEHQRSMDQFEFDIELESAPPNNTVRLSIETKGLDFLYQSHEVPDGSFRPDNVKGSYAVYHNEKSGNQYRAGKFCHIYRPYVTDANGKREWCDMDIIGDVMKITIPDGLIYPVVIDPTFGVAPDSPGGTWSGDGSYNWPDDCMWATTHTSPANIDTAQSITAYVKIEKNNFNVKGCIYLRSTGVLITNGVGAPSPEVTSSTGEWITSTFGTDPDPANSTEYALGVIHLSGDAPCLAWDATNNQSCRDTSNSYASPESVSPLNFDNDNEMSIYCTYTEGAPPTGGSPAGKALNGSLWGPFAGPII